LISQPLIKEISIVHIIGEKRSQGNPQKTWLKGLYRGIIQPPAVEPTNLRADRRILRGIIVFNTYRTTKKVEILSNPWKAVIEGCENWYKI
jgi:hypothetical protein